MSPPVAKVFAAYTGQHLLPFRVVVDTQGRIAAAINHVTLTPTAVLIDKDGGILRRIIGEPGWGPLDFPAIYRGSGP